MCAPAETPIRISGRGPPSGAATCFATQATAAAASSTKPGKAVAATPPRRFVGCYSFATGVVAKMDTAQNATQALYVSEGLPQTKRVMLKDEDICLHCGLCAERCPTAAWDMRTFDLLLPYAGTAPQGLGVGVRG